MLYLEGEEPDVPTLKKLIRKGTLNLDFVPLVTGTAFKNKGVQPLLDAVVDYMPSVRHVRAAVLQDAVEEVPRPISYVECNA